jgi:hypothetical protein
MLGELDVSIGTHFGDNLIDHFILSATLWFMCCIYVSNLS